MTTIQATGNKVLIQLDEPEVKSGAIYIPDTAQKPAEWGTVLSVGSNVKEPIEKGDRVYVSRFQGTNLVSGDLDLIFIEDHRILLKGHEVTDKE